jgi:hypothetical protein
MEWWMGRYSKRCAHTQRKESSEAKKKWSKKADLWIRRQRGEVWESMCLLHSASLCLCLFFLASFSTCTPLTTSAPPSLCLCLSACSFVYFFIFLLLFLVQILSATHALSLSLSLPAIPSLSPQLVWTERETELQAKWKSVCSRHSLVRKRSKKIKK